MCVLIHSTNYGLGEKLFYACVKLSFQNRTVSFSVFSKKNNSMIAGAIFCSSDWRSIYIQMDVDTIFFSCNVFFSSKIVGYTTCAYAGESDEKKNSIDRIFVY